MITVCPRSVTCVFGHVCFILAPVQHTDSYSYIESVVCCLQTAASVLFCFSVSHMFFSSVRQSVRPTWVCSSSSAPSVSSVGLTLSVRHCCLNWCTSLQHLLSSPLLYWTCYKWAPVEWTPHPPVIRPHSARQHPSVGLRCRAMDFCEPKFQSFCWLWLMCLTGQFVFWKFNALLAYVDRKLHRFSWLILWLGERGWQSCNNNTQLYFYSLFHIV